MRLSVVAIVIAILLTGCTPVELPTPVKPVVLKRIPIPRTPLNLPTIDKVVSETVEWTIVTPDNVDEIFASMIANGNPPALFTVTSEGYENIAINTQGSLRVILQQKAVIKGYHTYYILSENSIVTYNANR
jgi:hypothetical protein